MLNNEQSDDSFSQLIRDIYKNSSRSKLFHDEDIYVIQDQPKKILILNTLEIMNSYPWNERFDDKSLMHGKLRTCKKDQKDSEKDLVKHIISYFKKSLPSPPLNVEKYYVLNKKGQLIVYEKWDSECSYIGIRSLTNFKCSILSNQEKLTRYPDTIGFVLEISHEK